MRKIILFSIIQQLFYHISGVESLSGLNVTPISHGEFPYIASFQYVPGEDNFCGGALITNKHVITSAYCLRNLSRENFRIVFEVAHAQEPALVAYTVASWTTYIDWAQGQGIPCDSSNGLGMAIVTLTDKVDHVNPVPLNGLTKRQLNGARAKMIGWRNDVLSKATVKFLSNADCERTVRVLRNNVGVLDVRTLCSAGVPSALLGNSDSGAPLLHARDNSLLGIAFGFCPPDELVHGNFSTDFIQQHRVNLHYSVNYYRLFIHSVIPAIPGA